jgi:hypothetical protein
MPFDLTKPDWRQIRHFAALLASGKFRKVNRTRGRIGEARLISQGPDSKKAAPGAAFRQYRRLASGLALAGLEPGLRLVDDIDAALAAHHAAIAVAQLERAERVSNLHGFLLLFAALVDCAFLLRCDPDKGPMIPMVGGTRFELVTPTMST